MLLRTGGREASRDGVAGRAGAAVVAPRLSFERSDDAVGGTLVVASGRSDAGRSVTGGMTCGASAVVATGAAIVRCGGALVDVSGCTVATRTVPDDVA